MGFLIVMVFLLGISALLATLFFHFLFLDKPGKIKILISGVFLVLVATVFSLLYFINTPVKSFLEPFNEFFSLSRSQSTSETTKSQESNQSAWAYTMPNLKGIQEDSADRKISPIADDLEVKKNYVETFEALPGEVLSQSIPPGIELANNSSVSSLTLNIAKEKYVNYVCLDNKTLAPNGDYYEDGNTQGLLLHTISFDLSEVDFDYHEIGLATFSLAGEDIGSVVPLDNANGSVLISDSISCLVFYDAAGNMIDESQDFAVHKDETIKITFI